MYTLLIADDEPMECDAIELLVKQAKFPLRIIKARNGLEAVQFFRQHGPDIIFLDIRMPGMDGLEAARLIRSEKADIPIVFLTAWSTFEFAQQAVRLQANEYLVKPVSRKDIFDLLDRILEQLEAKKAISEEREKEVRQTLNLFSTEFFTALKYNNLKEEAVSKYFTMQGIRGTQGIALVINGITEREINAVFASLNVRVCYFPSNQYTTVLLFSNQGTKLIEQLPHSSTMHDFIIGTGIPFTGYGEISTSILTATIAYSYAYNNNLSFQRYSEVLQKQSPTGFENQLVEQILTAILRPEEQAALLHASTLINTAIETAGCLEGASALLYEPLTFLSYQIAKAIPLLHIPKVPALSVMEQEAYLMDLINSAIAAREIDRRDRYERAFEYVKQYLTHHLDEPITVEKMASIVGINCKYFSTLCRTYLDASFVEYLTTLRMERAYELLKDEKGNYLVKDVAEATGFTDTNYFSRIFRQHWGISPSSVKEAQSPGERGRAFEGKPRR